MWNNPQQNPLRFISAQLRLIFLTIYAQPHELVYFFIEHADILVVYVCCATSSASNRSSDYLMHS